MNHRAVAPKSRGRSLRSAMASCALVVAAVGAASPVHAQAHSEDPQAEVLVARGIQLRAQGKDNEALEAFRQAAEIEPDSVRVQIHLATVYQALGNWLLADEYLTRALSQPNHPYVVRHRRVLDDAKKVIDENIGRLEVDGEPPGADVRLNGRLVGTLPLTAPVRVIVGSYLLEVQREGYYPMRRPIVLSGGSLVRESIRLEPLPADARGRTASFSAAPGATEPGVDAGQPRTWLTWTLAGAAGVAGGVTLGAVLYREEHAEHWNDNTRCLELNRTREEVCGEEREKVETGETVALVSGVLTGVFAAGAVLNAVGVFGASSPPAEVGLHGCSVGVAGASCFGTF